MPSYFFKPTSWTVLSWVDLSDIRPVRSLPFFVPTRSSATAIGRNDRCPINFSCCDS
ncbi:hypothetical protein LEP1GSC052_0606 [Leptospira kmetyi serovar Malaysia str. Bejo-Iso9]|nr:hypothetical protein LEP1GSC052_0606 [Leptospira kmetyi serovar Malaysia str. Bejo-Iso9]